MFSDKNNTVFSDTTHPIAVIGMACRLPGGNETPEDYWTFLLDKGCGIREIPSDRWNAEAFYDPNPDAITRSASKWGGFLDDIRHFDAGFFGLSPREAASMDPQQRLVLSAAQQALEDSRIPVTRYAADTATTGVFVGISQSDYRTLQELRPSNPESFAGTGYALCIAANRVSHRLNLRGPSFAVDTACSSSLVALNEAVQSLLGGACDHAVAVGVNILAHPSSYIAFSRAGMLSKTGTVSTFDTAANGFVRGEGVGAVVLKPYAKALADGDRIHALIHATAVNQDGRTPTITAPSQTAQMDMLSRLFARSNVRRAQVGYVEAHGTGTPVGDPIEAGAIGLTIGQANPDGPVLVGSSKANVGHGEAAAGITGLIKAILAVKHAKVPPNINFSKPNPNIPFDALNLRVPQREEDLPESNGMRFAVVNSFGFGGTNASALVSSAPERADRASAHRVAALPPASARRWPLFFPLSAGSQDGLKAEAVELLRATADGGPLSRASLEAISAALACTRSHHAHRAVILARDLKTFRAGLEKLASDDADAIAKDPDLRSGQVRTATKLCFMFAGQGSQWWGMARDFMLHEPAFAKAVEEYDAHFVKAAGWSISKELLRDEATSRIDDTTVTQPALFAIQTGLAALWAQFGIKPDMVVGHSIGEAAASFVAGGLSLKGAARFLSKRGAIRDQLGQRGAMAAIGMGLQDVEAILPEHGLIGIAAVNGPGSVTVSGDYDAIHAFVEEFGFSYPETFIRLLKVDTAWHSYQLDVGEAWFRREVSNIDWTVPEIPVISTVTGKPETRFDTNYAWLNLRRPVMFQQGIETALKLGATTFLELGPHSTLAGPATSTALEAGARVDVLNSISRKGCDFDVFARTAADLFIAGYALDWETLTGGTQAGVTLPRALRRGHEYWSDNEESRAYLKSDRGHPFLGKRMQGAAHSYIAELNTKAYPWIKDHRLQSDTIFPGAGYIDINYALARQTFGDKPVESEKTAIHDALFLPDDQDVLLCSTFDEERGRALIFSRLRDGGEDWTPRAEGTLRVTDVPPPKAPRFDPDAKSATEIPLEQVYDVDASLPFVNYGDNFQVVRRLWALPGRRVVAHLSVGEGLGHTRRDHGLHPALLDGCLQLCDPRMTKAGLAKGRGVGDLIFLPVGAARMRVYGPLPDDIMVHAHHVYDAQTGIGEAGFVATDMDGTVLMTGEGLRMKAMPTHAAQDAEAGPVAQFACQVLTALREPFSPDDAFLHSGSWAVIGGENTAADALADTLSSRGADVLRLPRSDLGADLAMGLDTALGQQIEDGTLAGIVFAGGLGLPLAEESTPPDALLAPIEAQVCDLIALGNFVELYRGSDKPLPRLAVLTRGAYPDAGDWARAAALSQAPLLAVTRALVSELMEFDIRHADIAPDAPQPGEVLADYLLSPTHESEILLGAGGLRAPRLERRSSEDFEAVLMHVPADDASINFFATMRHPGLIEDLDLQQLPMPVMGPDEVRIRIAAVGLNFRDIMAVTGLLPAEAEPDPAWQNLGLEFGAVVEAVGDNVSGFKPGDRVMGMQRRCLQRFMVVSPKALSPVPDHISLQEAATIPSAFATAHYALNRVGRMRAGEKVLIHVATGGVGTAAVQLAQAAGAEIFATAGNPAKRKLLRERGVSHVMDSRSLKFADDVERITKGAGVDLLLNSLPGDYIRKGLDIMAPYGRFLEIGKRDVYSDAPVSMKALRRNVSFSVLDLAAMGQERPELLADLMAELCEKFAARDLQPLPLTAFPISRIADAFRHMSQARHVGKVVITLDEDHFSIRRDTTVPVALSGSAGYLVTGGTGGFGLTIADWLSRAGAGHLWLASRSGRVAETDVTRLAAITSRGTSVEVVALDVTDASAVEGFVAGVVTDQAHPLRGVVHGAAVIKDGFVTQLTPETISDVLRPKVLGGWALHRGFAKAGVQPDFLIGFSSVAQMIGSGGQANYVAANAFLDALAAYRRGAGLAGCAISWGAIADSGFVARSEGLANYLEFVGLAGLSDAETDLGMEIALSRDMDRFVYARVDWAQMAQANRALGRTARFAPLLDRDKSASGEVRAHLMLLEGDAVPEAARAFLVDEVSSVLNTDAAAIQTDRPMSELGLDSLSSFELKMRVETALGLMLPVSKFLQAPSIDDLTDLLTDEIAALKAAVAVAQESGEHDSEDATAGAASTACLASETQLGVLADALSSHSSASACKAFEHEVVIACPQGADAPALEAALTQLALRHPILTARIAPLHDGGLLSFGEHGPRVVEGTDDTLLDLAAGETLRVALTQNTLTLTTHAAICDAPSLALIARELTTVLNAGAKELPRAVSREVAIGLPGLLRFDAETPAAQNDAAFWHYSLAPGASPVRFAGRARALLPVVLGRDHGAPAEVSGTAPAADEAAQLTAFATAIRQATGTQGRVLISRIARVEAHLPKASVVGPFTIAQPMTVSPDANDAVAQALLRRTLQRALEHARVDAYAAARLYADQFESWGVTPFQFAFERVEDAVLALPVAGIGYDLMLQVAPHGVRLIRDSDVVGADMAAEIVAIYAQSVIEQAGQPA